MKEKSFTIFIEYRIKEDMWLSFVEIIPEIQHETAKLSSVTSHEFLTGSEQPFRVVEEVRLTDWEIYQQLRPFRTDGEHPLFSKWHSMIQGGKEKIHIWAFEPIL
ncbi:hypothetical protein [Hazenella coriacea]|uniref:ABM domain-containing protein n=1 Tax=Hazenella coriacea TaxID=1179467 RepID=A0A4V2UUS4_9BACL|nr:hypothetical protein [Hazenella coriacea]TCS92800.1 hypothetical protein EDD58_11026 [Hazenella coriacea]